MALEIMLKPCHYFSKAKPTNVRLIANIPPLINLQQAQLSTLGVAYFNHTSYFK